MPICPLLFVTTTLVMLLGCTAPDTLPRDLPTLRTVYESHLTDSPSSAPDAHLRAARTGLGTPLQNGAVELAGYTRTAYNEIENLFPTLPNPTLVMYIDPHLSEAGYPIPGYATAFTLYEKTEFALPGEVPPPAWLTATGRGVTP
ncbi:MAG: TIGR03751 family conjugal transfer lipoprotein [Candidatus Competibacteraceae bacterium]|nr:TIGR03751 family conjugal transfer lipoprotein [Candidatus Competibacteraceae bacterium]